MKELQDLLREGEFRSTDEDILKEFKTQTANPKVEVLQFKRRMTFQEVIEELETMSRRPANATELFAWHLENKDWLKEHKYQPVIALGSISSSEDGYHKCCAIYRTELGTDALIYQTWQPPWELTTQFWEGSWGEHCWFACCKN